MSLYLNVPYADNDEVEALGALWDSSANKWYVEIRPEYHKFKKWILSSDEDECIVLCDYFYIVESVYTCFKCKKTTPIVGFGIENYYTFYQDASNQNEIEREYSCGTVHISPVLKPLSQRVQEYLKKAYNYYYGYSKFTNSYYYGNHCKHCGVLLGEHFLFCEVDSPFSVHSIETAKALKLLRVRQKNDIKVYVEEGYCSGDHLIKSYANIIDRRENTP